MWLGFVLQICLGFATSFRLESIEKDCLVLFTHTTIVCISCLDELRYTCNGHGHDEEFTEVYR